MAAARSPTTSTTRIVRRRRTSSRAPSSRSSGSGFVTRPGTASRWTFGPAPARSQLEHLDEIRYLARRRNVVQTAELEYDDDGKVITTTPRSRRVMATITIVGQRLPDLVRLVEDQLLATKFPLQLTRPTVGCIIAAASRPEGDAPSTTLSGGRASSRSHPYGHYRGDGRSTSATSPIRGGLVGRRGRVRRVRKGEPAPGEGRAPKNGVRGSGDGTNLYDHVIYDSPGRSIRGSLENHRTSSSSPSSRAGSAFEPRSGSTRPTGPSLRRRDRAALPRPGDQGHAESRRPRLG